MVLHTLWERIRLVHGGCHSEAPQGIAGGQKLVLIDVLGGHVPRSDEVVGTAAGKGTPANEVVDGLLEPFVDGIAALALDVESPNGHVVGASAEAPAVPVIVMDQQGHVGSFSSLAPFNEPIVRVMKGAILTQPVPLIAPGHRLGKQLASTRGTNPCLESGSAVDLGRSSKVIPRTRGGNQQVVTPN